MNPGNIAGTEDMRRKLLRHHLGERFVILQLTSALGNQRSGWSPVARQTQQITPDKTARPRKGLVLRVKRNDADAF